MKDLTKELSSLRSVKAPQALRERIGVLASQLAPPLHRLPILFNFRYAFAIFLLFLASGSGVIVASQRSLPGSILYPVKKAVEDVRLELTSDASSRVELHTQNADRRTLELQESLETRNPQTFKNLSRDYEQEVTAAVEEIEKIEVEKKSAAQNVNEHLETHTEVLQNVANRVPEPAQPAIEHAIEVSTKAKDQVSAILSTTPMPSAPKKQR